MITPYNTRIDLVAIILYTSKYAHTVVIKFHSKIIRHYITPPFLFGNSSNNHILTKLILTEIIFCILTVKYVNVQYHKLKCWSKH